MNHPSLGRFIHVNNRGCPLLTASLPHENGDLPSLLDPLSHFGCEWNKIDASDPLSIPDKRLRAVASLMADAMPLSSRL